MFPDRIALALVGLAVVSPFLPAQEKKPPLVTRERVQLNLAGAVRYKAATTAGIAQQFGHPDTRSEDDKYVL